jgi:hypothetical protein
MTKDPSSITYYGQVSPAMGTTLPSAVTITNSSDTPNTMATVPLVDEVVISSAVYNSNNQMLTIQATSGDKLDSGLTLVALGYGPIDPSTGTLMVQTAIPPSEVTVVSNHNGRDTRSVTLTAQSIDASAPYAANDILTDDVAAEASTTINILTNDVPSMGVRPRLLAQALHGTVTIDELAGTATYTPKTGYSGPDSFSYINNYNGMDSNVALVSFNVGFVNLAPTVKDDVASVGAGTPVTIDVLANDTDPNVGDSLDPATVTITSLPAAGDVVVNTNGTVTYAPAPGTSGDFSFQYTVADSHGLMSAAANVTVTVLPADNLSNIQATYVAKDGRWRIRGNASIPGPGNTITIHIGRTLTGPVLGTIGVDTAGAFDFVVRSSSIKPDPTNTVSLESTKGGQALAVPVQVQ